MVRGPRLPMQVLESTHPSAKEVPACRQMCAVRGPLREIRPEIGAGRQRPRLCRWAAPGRD